MPCFSNFCCGYGLRSGGSFIGYFSIIIYVKLLILCVIFLWSIKTRIDESEGIDDSDVFNKLSRLLRVRSNNYELESSIQELKSEKVLMLKFDQNNRKFYEVHSVFFFVYLLFLLFGVLCASFLITGAKLVSDSMCNLKTFPKNYQFRRGSKTISGGG